LHLSQPGDRLFDGPRCVVGRAQRVRRPLANAAGPTDRRDQPMHRSGLVGDRQTRQPALKAPCGDFRALGDEP